MSLHPAKCLAAVVLLLAASAGAGSEPPSISPGLFAPLLFETLGARAMDCPPEATELGSRAPADCARVDRTWKQIKKTVRSFLNEQDPDDAFRNFAWKRKGELRTRLASIGGLAIRIAYHTTDGWIALAPTYLCLDPVEMERIGATVADGKEVSQPRIVQRGRAPWPAKPRQRGVTEGHAIVEALIDAEGKVAHACVVVEAPPGNDFGLAAVQAVSGHRFEPATKSGRPVPVTYVTAISWSMGPG